MCENKDLVEINLSTANSAVCEQKSSYNNNMSLLYFKDRVATACSKIPYKQSLAVGGGIEIVPIAYKSPTDLSGLRQMYCPDCRQRLHADAISYDRLLYCCLPIFPFKCLIKRAIERRQSGNKVLCKKCGGNLGYWKQK